MALPALAHAQISRLYDTWRWVRFGTESGLPSERVLRVYESGKGDVWAHTGNGLARFDGFRWRPAVLSKIEQTVWPLLPVAADTAGILVHYQGELLSLRDSIVELIPVRNEKGPIPVSASWREPGGALILLGDTALYRMSGTDVSPMNSPHATAKVTRVQPPVSGYSLLDTDGDLWLKAGTTLCRYHDGRWEEAFHSPFRFLRVLHLVENASGSGMAVLEIATGIVRLFEWSSHGALRELQAEAGDLIQSIAVNAKGEFLVLYASGELRLRVHGSWSRLQPLPMSVEKPRFLCFRPNEDLWVGGENGLFLCRITLERWTNWREASPSLTNVVNEIVRARDGSFWIGTRDGVQVRSPDGRVRWFHELHGVPLGRVTAIGEDQSGRIWIGSGASFSGAFCWDGHAWTRYGAEQGLKAPRIHRIEKDRKGRLWFLGLAAGQLSPDLAGEPGAFVLDGERFTRWGKEEGLLDGRVYSFVEDPRGGYWFGTWSGLSHLHEGKWAYYRKGSGLIESRMWTMAGDSSGRIYFSHQYTGLGYIDGDDSIHYISGGEGILSYPIFEVEVDRRGWLWIATLNGLVCWDGTDWIRLDSRSGLPNDQLWPILPLEREVLVGTQGDGVAVLRLDGLNSVSAVVNVANPTIEGNDATIAWQPYAYWGDLPSSLIRTRFRTAGGAWSVWGTERSITLRNLTPGTYRIEVQPDLPFNQEGARIAARTFVIPPPLLLRPEAAIPLALLLSLTLVMLAVGWNRYRSYNRRIRENEARFRAQYRAIPVPTVTFKKGADGFVMSDCNDAALAITGGRATGWLGKSAAEIVPDRSQQKGLLDRCVESRSVIRSAYRFEHPELPDPIEVDLTLAFVSPDLVLVHAEDITARKRDEQHLQESREQLRALAARLESVREEERTALSREIHDELGQLITGLKMDLSWLRRRVVELGQGIPEAVSQRIVQMNSLLDDAIHTVRKIAGELRPAVLDDLGLVAAIEWQARDFGERTGIRCETALGMDDVTMGRGAATELFRIYQELLTNVARHAQATVVQIALTRQDGFLTLEVRDNGRGIRLEEIRRPASLGILGMEERAFRLHGTLSIAPGERGGTVARVEVPLNEGEEG